MELSVTISPSGDINKNIFKLKPPRKDGLLLNIHHSKPNNKIRFIHTAFHDRGHVLASADNEGNFYIVDFHTCKYWGLPKLDSCTFLRFSAYRPDELLCGRNNGDVYVVHYESGTVTGTLCGHKSPVKDATFGGKSGCLTTSQYEAIVWSLETNTKIQVLNLEKNNALKHVVFIPKSNYTLACFQDDLIQVWDNTDFDCIKQFLPINWKNYSVKSIAFTKNGQIMVVAGYLPTLVIFSLDHWKLLKIVNLPEHIHTVKHVEFVQRPFDGGCNRILAILSGQGMIYFYNVEENAITSQLTTQYEVSKFSLCPNGSYVACVLCSGDVELYCLSNYVECITEDEPCERKVYVKAKRCAKKIGHVKEQISEILEINKLKAILAEFGTYPEAHRTKIWEKLLKLPNNIQQYNSIINHVTVVAFQDLKQKYPLENKLLMKSLKKLLNNLTTWNSFFAIVDYMPIFVFPFIKVFNNKPVACFEAICTIICNWCQHFFEYHPLAPVNILAMIENILLEHDPMLLHHYSLHKVTAHIYAWPLLESAFSEVLTASEWLQLWDHILTYEVSFFHCVVVAYNIVQRHILLSFRRTEDFVLFFYNQNPVNMKRLLKVTFRILEETSKDNHPREFLTDFKGLDIGNYPLFTEYPKSVVEYQLEEERKIDEELESIVISRAELDNFNKEENKEKAIRQEQEKRVRALEEKCLEKLRSKKEFVQQEREKVDKIKQLLSGYQLKQSDIQSDESSTPDLLNFKKSEEIFHNRKSKQESSIYNQEIMPGVAESSTPMIEDMFGVKEQYLMRLKKLLEYKHKINDLLDKSEKHIGDKELKAKIEGQINKMNRLQKETKGLEKEVAKLLQLVSKDTKIIPYLQQENMGSLCNCPEWCEKKVRFSPSSSGILE
ncbi:unnamed protein product [Acanthoscelides obtectus]|uniref:TBC1 domain family member 31 n=1 Tax=Acanthoscelides obtectus TaxID=200917 RepID=A0A9P0LCX3_ACAOB|nr:unnamed protein product [Acanthoscelides obtectus]CAK1656806.1 TBC1 domain family member 31 [Acanthoscelides obtectus]